MHWKYFGPLCELFHIIDFFLAKQGMCPEKIVYSQKMRTRKFTIGNNVGGGGTEARCLYLGESASCIILIFIKFHKYFNVSDDGGRRCKVRRR